MRVGNDPLGLEGGDHRAPQTLRERGDPVHVEAGAVTDDDHRPLGGSEQPDGILQRIGGRRNGPAGHPAGGASRLAALGRRQHLDLVGKNEVRYPPVQDRALARQVDQFGVLAGVKDRLAPLRDLPERGLQVDFLERPRSEHLRVDLPGQRQHRRAVDVRVPEPGQKIRRPGPRNGQTGRRPTGELPVRRGGERRRSLVADPHESHLARGFPAPDRVGKPQIGVPHHPPHPPHPPVHQSLRHNVRDRLDVHFMFGQPYVDPVLAHVDLVGSDSVVVAARGLARQRMEIPAVPGAAQPPVLDGALAQGPALMRALVVERGVDALVAGHADGLAAAAHGLHAALGQLVGGEDLEPADPLGGGRRAVTGRGRGRAVTGAGGYVGHGTWSPFVVGRWHYNGTRGHRDRFGPKG